MTLRGIYCAAATPVRSDLSPDLERLASHAVQLIADGCHGVALLGTTGEANSFSPRERMAMLEAVVGTGIEPDALLPGTGMPSIPDTVDLSRHALSLGIETVVVLPPFYYKNVPDDGLIDFYSRVIESVNDPGFKIILYHIPQFSGVPISAQVIEALLHRYGGVIAGIKDSAGDLDHMKDLARSFPQLSVFAGADPLMQPLLAKGGSGCITATSNLVARELRTIFDATHDESQLDIVTQAQARVVALRNASNAFSQIPTIKAMIARRYHDPAWLTVRPPLRALDQEQLDELYAILASSGDIAP